MTDWDPATNGSTLRAVTYDRSPPGAEHVADRLTTTERTRATRVTTPFELIAACSPDTTDCLVCWYDDGETAPAIEALYELLGTSQPVPLVLYCREPASLPAARKLGATAVHLARERHDEAALDDRIAAAIDRHTARTNHQQTAVTATPTLYVAGLNEAGIVTQIATTSVDDESSSLDTGRPLWTYPWAPDEGTVKQQQQLAAESAIADESAGPTPTVRPEDADSSLVIVTTTGGDVETPYLALGAITPETEYVAGKIDGANTESTETEPSAGQQRDEADESCSESTDESDTERTTVTAQPTRPIESDILSELHRTLTEASGSFTEKVETLLAVGQSYLNMDAGLVAAVDDDSYEVEIIQSDDELLGSVPAGMTISLSETICERTPARDETYAVDDIVTEAPELTDRAAVTEFGGARYIGTPIQIANKTYGTLCFYGTETSPTKLTDRDQLIVEFMAQLVTYELEHHLQQQELKTATSELESLFDRVDDAFFSLNADWEFVYINDRARTLLGVENTELIGENVWEQFEDARESIFYQQYTKAVESQETVSFEAPYDPLDSWLEVTAYPADGGLSVYFRDITERKARRTDLERYEQTLETVSDGVYALDEDERFTYVNEGLAELTGFARSELVGGHIGMFKSEQTVQAARNAVNTEIQRIRHGNGTGEVSIELDVETADGRTVRCQDHIALLPFDRRFRGSVGTIRDISEQVERERALNGLLEMTRALMIAETPSNVAETIVETVVSAIGFERAVIRLHDDETGQLVPTAVSETVSSEIGELSEISVGSGLVGSAFADEEPIVCEPVAPFETDAGSGTALSAVPIGDAGILCIGITDKENCSQQSQQLVQLLTANAEAAFKRTDRQQVLRRYESIVETVQEMLCVIDSSGRFRLVTEPLAARLGESRETLLERRAIDYVSESHRDVVMEMFEALWRETDQTEATIEAELRAKSGTTVPIRIEAARLPQLGGEGEIIVSVQDLSELMSAKQAAAAERERFSYLFENLTDPVDEVEITAEGPQIRTINSAFRHLFGEQAIEMDKTAHFDSPEPLALDEQRIVETDHPERPAADADREIKLQTVEGIKYFLYRNIPYELDETTRGFEIYTDVTALKQREIQLQVLHRLLRHNLRNDLNVIAGFADILATEAETDRHRGYANRIVSNATDLIKLSETAKTIEAVAGRQSLMRKPVELGALLSPAVDRFQTERPDAHITLEQSAPVAVEAGQHLRTAVSELIDNGIEHNTAETPTVTVRIDTDASDRTVSITVHDNGPGLPDEEWAVVAGDSEISQLEHGSGLGLWLVRWVAEGYGGELGYHRDQTGSSVTITLPRADVTTSEMD